MVKCGSAHYIPLNVEEGKLQSWLAFSIGTYPPTSVVCRPLRYDATIGMGHYEMMGGVCLSVHLSVCLSVACLDLNREWKGL